MSGKRWRTVVLSLCLILIFPLQGYAENPHRDQLLKDCASVEACLEILSRFVGDTDWHKKQGDEKAIADVLRRRFGDRAKQALLDKAIKGSPAWRDFAGLILKHWGEWSDADVPRLRDALKALPIPGSTDRGWPAFVLAEIGSEAAIDVLIEDLESHGANATSDALAQIGPSILPRLLDLLSRSETDFSAIVVIRTMKEEAGVIAPEWIAIAVDNGQPEARRVGALLGLEAIAWGGYIRELSPGLHTVLTDKSKAVREQGMKTLLQLKDPVVIPEIARRCKPRSGPVGYGYGEFCLVDISRFGAAAHDAGPELLPFLTAQNGHERAAGAETLGRIGYRPAAAPLEKLLEDPDWRATVAAIRSLVWLKARDSIPALKRAASDHWLPDFRDLARRAIDALDATGGGLKAPEPPDDTSSYWFGVTTWDLAQLDACAAGQWRWRNKVFTLTSAPYQTEHRFKLPGGELIGTDRGEFGGALLWQPKEGEPLGIHDLNVRAILPAADGAMVFFGYAHLMPGRGYAVHVTRAQDGTFRLRLAAQLTGAPEGAVLLREGLYAALANERVMVFTAGGIEGIAECTAPQRQERPALLQPEH